MCIYIYIYVRMHFFFRWTCVFSYAGEMERWTKFRCKRSAFQIAWIISTHLWFTYYWNWTCDDLLCPSAAVSRTLITAQLARLSENSSTNFCTAPSRWCGNFDGQVASKIILKFRTLVFLFWVPLWPSLFWQWVTPGYPVGCFRCRQLFVASDGARGWRPCIVPRLTEKGAEKGK